MNKMQQAIAFSAVDEIFAIAPDSIARRYRFAVDFIGFSGHFPGYPILPAIVQLLTVLSLIREHTGKPLRLTGVEDAKFLTPVRPDEVILAQYRQRVIGGKLLYDAQLTVADKKVATCLLQLVNGEESA